MAFLFIWQFILSGPLEIASGYIGFANYVALHLARHDGDDGDCRGCGRRRRSTSRCCTAASSRSAR